MIYYFLFCGIAFFCGIYFFPFGGVKRLKGIRNLSEEEKSAIKIKALGVNIGIMFYFLAAVFALAGTVAFFREHLFVWFMIAWFVSAVADAAFISKSGRYSKDKKLEVKKSEKRKEEESAA